MRVPYSDRSVHACVRLERSGKANGVGKLKNMSIV